MENLENIMNQLLPKFIYIVILSGILIILLSISIAIYSLVKRKQTVKDIKWYLFCTLHLGILIIFSGVLVSFMVNFEIDYSGYKQSIPFGYIASMITFLLLSNIVNKRKRDREDV